MKYPALALFSVLTTLPFAASAEDMLFSCERFKSNCKGAQCVQVQHAVQKDVDRKIFTVKRTEIVEYVINTDKAVETLKGEQAEVIRNRQLVITYKHVTNAYGKITLLNKDPKGNIKERADIEPTSGFYLYYLIHTDGSIKDVPIGEPYTAFFGWCKNNSPEGASLPDSTPIPQPVGEPPPPATEQKPGTEPKPDTSKPLSTDKPAAVIPPVTPPAPATTIPEAVAPAAPVSPAKP